MQHVLVEVSAVCVIMHIEQAIVSRDACSDYKSKSSTDAMLAVYMGDTFLRYRGLRVSPVGFTYSKRRLVAVDIRSGMG